MRPITTSFQRSSSSLLSRRYGGTCSPGGALATSSLGRRPPVARQPTPPSGVVATGLVYPRRNSFSAVQRPAVPDERGRPTTGYNVTADDTESDDDAINDGEVSRNFRSPCNDSPSTQHSDHRFGTTRVFLLPPPHSQ